MMIFKPKISHQKPIKPPLKADFNAYFTKKRMIFTPIYKICATPKGLLYPPHDRGNTRKREKNADFATLYQDLRQFGTLFGTLWCLFRKM